MEMNGKFQIMSVSTMGVLVAKVFNNIVPCDVGHKTTTQSK